MNNEEVNELSTRQGGVEIEKTPETKEKKKINSLFIVLGILIIIYLGLYFFVQKSQPNNEIDDEIYNPPVVLASNFAEYKEIGVNVVPKVETYSVKADLSNVSNAKDFTMSEEAKNLLVKNGFVVKPAYNDEFFPLYESNRYSFTPNFITTDSMLHNYHLMFDFLLKKLEEEKLASELKKLNSGMLAQSLSQYENLKGTQWENAAKRNVGFFSVGSKLLDPSVVVPSIVSGEVGEELKLIEAHGGIEKSPVMNIGEDQDTMIETPQGPQSLEALKEDYSQYIARGHYDNEELRGYFKSMMWYGRLTFRMKSDDEIKSAVLISLGLDKKENFESWNKIFEPVNFFVGKSDDITYYQFKELINKVYGEMASAEKVAIDEDKFTALVKETERLEPPQINSMPIFQASIQSDREKEIKGFRFMGQRFTIDAAIFQRLIYREVGDKSKSCAEFKPEETDCGLGARCLPRGLDIPGAMGSDEAKNILSELGEDKYACYPENMSKMSKYLSELDLKTWTQNLYWGWLYQLRPLLEEKGSGYPFFMQNSAWARKELNTFLGSWTELKHDTILYAKQVYAEMGAGGPEEKDDRGYVEPNPKLYARLASLLKMTSEGLEIRGLLSQEMKDNLNKLEILAISLKTISEKELTNEKLTDEEYELIRSYGGQLEHFWLEVNKDEPAFKESTSQRDYLYENPAAIVADVATDPNGSVLEEGTGKIAEIYVVVPVEGKLKIVNGGVYSYFEFEWPMSDRLTDKKWREMLLDSEKVPDLPTWTKTFVAK